MLNKLYPKWTKLEKQYTYNNKIYVFIENFNGINYFFRLYLYENLAIEVLFSKKLVDQLEQTNNDAYNKCIFIHATSVIIQGQIAQMLTRREFK